MKVFVSSTYEDLIDHRREVDQILSRLAVQFKGMEYFGARPFDPKTACFREVQQCDVFLGIYAHRYGWMPDGDTTSITEQEFDEARRAGKPCYCYVVSDDHPWNPKLIEVPALDKIKRFHAKVGTLVRSRFTTPDNLAKQISADLVASFTGRDANRNAVGLTEFLRTCTAHEIATTVSTKYIRDLYVWRNLDHALDVRLLQGSQTPKNLRELADDLTAVRSAYNALALKKTVASFMLDDTVLNELVPKLRHYAQLSPTATELNYPAQDLANDLARSRALLLRLLEIHAEQVRSPQDATIELRNVAASVQTAIARSAETNQVLRPVYLIVDRAGGGKTNLLCHLAERAGTLGPVFFLAAKTVPTPTVEAIEHHLASVYPTSLDPVADALRAIADSFTRCLLIIDGINEHPDPRAFNAALKALVRRYYHKPVTFVISCRDVYWRYFEDEWWNSHGAFVSHDALYSFTRVEFRRALPLYLQAFDIEVDPIDDAKAQLHHPLLLRFFCEAYRGSPILPNRMGTLSELRLLQLFDAYCERKFEHIRQRLGLYDASEILRFVRALALTMVETRTRALPIAAVTDNARLVFGPRSFRTADSPYMQILDEDIVIEERPLSDLSDTVVSFVYDAFMEYMIARAIWSNIVHAGGNRAFEIHKHLDQLTSIRSKFISAAGVILFLGEILTRDSRRDALAYIEELLDRGLSALACDLAVRLSAAHPSEDIYSRVLRLLGEGTRRQRSDAWLAVARLASMHWTQTIDFMTHTKAKVIDGSRAFSLLRRGASKMSLVEQRAALRLVHSALCGEGTAIAITRDIDRATGRNAATNLVTELRTGHSPEGLEDESKLWNDIHETWIGVRLRVDSKRNPEDRELLLARAQDLQALLEAKAGASVRDIRRILLPFLELLQHVESRAPQAHRLTSLAAERMTPAQIAKVYKSDPRLRKDLDFLLKLIAARGVH